ncbi:MAG: hypothetical protein EOM91_23795 [Sphingobacteriia bacterium]|nr:hypothetical protein [Sphingobacteriia bacterium]
MRRAAEHGAPLPRAMLHAREDGSPFPDALAPVRFSGDGRVIRVLGIGETGMEQLYAGAPAMIDALRSTLGGMPKVQYQGGRFAASHMEHSVPYRFDAVVARLPRHLVAACREGRLDDLLEFVGERLQASLARQFAWILPDQPVPRVEELQITKSVGVALKAGKWRTAFWMTGKMPIKLIGPWQVGSLQARGYGRISRVRSGMPFEGSSG